MIVHCTQKLLHELKILPEEETIPGNPLWSWHGNSFQIGRRKCVLITNDITLYAVFIPALKKSDFRVFNTVLGHYLFKNLLHENISQQQIEAILSDAANIQYKKSANRSILGSMNQQRFQLEYYIEAEGGG